MSNATFTVSGGRITGLKIPYSVSTTRLRGQNRSKLDVIETGHFVFRSIYASALTMKGGAA